MWDDILGTLFLEFFVRPIVRGPGFLVCCLFRPEVTYDDDDALLAGFLFWMIVIGGLIAFFVFT